MPTIRLLALCVLVFVSAAVIDYAETRYVRAVRDASDGVSGADRAAARWSVVMYAVGCLGFVAVVDVSLWLMIPEGLGFYVGTRVALHTPCQTTCVRHNTTA